ncbi:unnamed protein product [Ceutorhynchus assimilis]|uniref:Fringe-like glycosyltransferase domain-containing protein n=1 Tax=Ceutorhynchus assimilis TaxID=467358 RepID=A0A9N9MWV1_9CUCU|nr:unnamed protein product [Ceutorhynchus assimilis]CAG9771605.1 unnamed protein product [Ceutorhynchus assimilis]
MKRHFITIICLLLVGLSEEVEHVAFVIVSQNNDYNDALAKELERNLEAQSQEMQIDKPEIYISNKVFDASADWIIAPIIAQILDKIDKNCRWIVFLEDRTTVSLKLLLDALNKWDFNNETWIGHASYDSDATIIHHFAFHGDPKFFKYPNLASGMALSIPLLKRLRHRLEKGYKQPDFFIDPAHEFSLFVYEDGRGLMIQHEPLFCSKEEPNCATYPHKFQSCEMQDYNGISSIFFAIKTCQKFHDERLRVVQKTWLEYTVNTAIFSDVTDSGIPTLSLDVPNTEQGHCQKTMAILQYALKIFDNNRKLRWLVLVDDDTILSVSGILNLTNCYQNATRSLILGERYRFGVHGFNYPTGGAGIVINRQALEILAKACQCMRPDSPDDMVIGACALEHGLTLVHIPQLHQARPDDYAPGRLAVKDAISFHKHWMIDPIKTYKQWFLANDERMFKPSLKTEL